MKHNWLVRVALLFALTCMALFAQSDLGTITGFVKDPSGATIPGATVVARSEATGQERRATTNEAGSFTITNTPSGFYTISVEAKGFKKFEVKGNKLDTSASLTVEATLTVGSASETVEVSASAVRLQTESASVQKLITREQIDGLELNGRNPVGLAALVPGARGGNMSGLSFSFGQGPANFNGSRNPENLITYDGAPATRTRSNGTSLGSADVDSTSEVQILTGSYNAEYGRTSGAQIRILTRSGTSVFHGAVYEYFRNDKLNANTWTRNRTPDVAGVIPFSKTAPQRYNQFGYNFGGPVYIPNKFNKDKNKFFLYFAQEYVRFRQLAAANWTVPTNRMRQGDFGELLTNTPANILGRVVQLMDPVTRQPIAGNLIPVNQRSASGLGILRAYPVPNLATLINGTNNYYVTASAPQDQRKDTLAADFNLTDTKRVTFRRNNFKFKEYQPLDGTPTRTPKFFDRPNQTNSINYVWTISPTLVNEAIATASLDNVYIPVDTPNFFDRTSVGINYPYIFPAGKLIPTRIPTANITGLNGLNGGPYPSHSSGPIYTVTDSLTWVKGKHTFKFGFYYEKSGQNDNDQINVAACPTCTNNQNGQFNFTDTRSNNPNSGNAIANVAMGLFDSYSELGQRSYTIYRGSSYEPFFQDTWKVNPRLTVNYGVRYTVIVPYRALWGNLAVFDPVLYDRTKEVSVVRTGAQAGQVIVGAGDRYNGMVVPGTAFPESGNGRFPESTSGTFDYLHRGGTYPDYYSNIQWGQIQPRVGVAYQLNDKTVIRAGGGRFYTRLGVSDSVFLGGNPPFQPTANVSFGNVDNPGGTTGNSLPLTVTAQSRDFKNPEAFNWNVTVERETFFKSILSVAYVGRRGLHLQRESNINQPTPATVAANPGVNLDALRPFKGYNSIRVTDNVANSRYNSLQVAWNRRFTGGLLFGMAFTLSKSEDDGSNQRDIIPNSYDARGLWAASDFDVRRVLIVNFLYELPIFRGQNNLAGKTLGGWQVSGIFQASSGLPVSVGRNQDYAGVGQDGSMNGAAIQYWKYNGGGINYLRETALNGSAEAKYWISVPLGSDGRPTQFTQPGAGTFVTTDIARNVIYNPGFNNWNLGLFKKFAITERFAMQFRAEAFNTFNHPNLSGIGTDPANLGTFGKITGKTNDVRNLQLSLRLQF